MTIWIWKRLEVLHQILKKSGIEYDFEKMLSPNVYKAYMWKYKQQSVKEHKENNKITHEWNN